MKKDHKKDTIQLMFYKTKSPKETEEIAVLLVEKIVKTKKGRGAVVVALEGELGAGKTVFVQGFAKALGVKVKIKSPTFALIKRYPFCALPFALCKFYHIDCYRLKNYKDLLSLGIREILKEPQSVILIEWAERVRPILPKKHIRVHIDHISQKERKITILLS